MTRSSLFATALALSSPDPVAPGPEAAPPAVGPNPRAGAASASYHDAADAHESTVQTCMTHLQGLLGDQGAIWLSTLREAARQQGRMQVYAEIQRLPLSDIKGHVEHKKLHVISRLHSRFGIRINLKELNRVAPDWERQPVSFQNEHTLMRQVRYRGATFHAVYEVHRSGGKFLSTVVQFPTSAGSPASQES